MTASAYGTPTQPQGALPAAHRQQRPTDPAELEAFLNAFFAEQMEALHIPGRQGTVQTACWSETPMVGVGFQFEQEENLDMLVRSGMGVRIPLREFYG